MGVVRAVFGSGCCTAVCASSDAGWVRAVRRGAEQRGEAAGTRVVQEGDSGRGMLVAAANTNKPARRTSGSG